jgi:hypothetical protein
MLPAFSGIGLLVLVAVVSGLAAGAVSARPPVAATTPDFVIIPAHRSFDRPCVPRAAAGRIVSMLRAFNRGDGARAAAAFAQTGSLEPYTGTQDAAIPRAVGRRLIARYVLQRHRTGDGWTASAVAPPSGHGGRPLHAIYAVRLVVQLRGVEHTAAAKIVLNCRSGLIERWVGPRVRTS